MELLQSIEQLGVVRLLKSSFIAYPVVNALHIAAIGALLTGVVLMDLAVLGWIRSLPREKFIALLRRVVFVAFFVAALTGLALFSVQATNYVQNPAFLLKLGLIGLAALNFIAFSTLYRTSRAEGISPSLRVSAVVSIVLWTGVLLCGRFIGFL